MVDTEPLRLFDLDAARAERDDAMQAVDLAADSDWKIAAEVVIRSMPAEVGFIGVDIWKRLELYDVATHERRALGPIMMRLARAGVIYKTGEYRPSALSHAAPMAVWCRRR